MPHYYKTTTLFQYLKMYKHTLPNLVSFKPTTHKLGRWEIDYRDHIVKRKVELANEDHCGPCGFTHKDTNM